MLLARAEAAGVVILREAKVARLRNGLGFEATAPAKAAALKGGRGSSCLLFTGAKKPWALHGAWVTLAAQLSPLLLLLAGAKAAGAQRLSKVAPSGWNYGGKQRRGQPRSFSQAVQRGCAELSLQSSQN